MILTTITVTYGRTHNLSDYNSARIDCVLSAELENGDNEADCAAALWEMAKNNVKSQLIPLVKDNEAKVENIFMGLPVKTRETLKGVSNAD